MVIISSFFILLIISAFFSSYETAFYSLERQSSRPKNRSILFSLNVILIGNASVRVLFSELGGYNLERFVESQWGISGAASHILIIGIISVILILFGESLPLNFGMAYPHFVHKRLKWFISIATVILYPIARPLSFFIDRMIRFLQKKNESSAQDAMTAEEVRSIIQLSYEREIVNPNEKRLTDAVIALYSQAVSFYMVPRREILFVDWEEPLSLAWKRLKEASATKLLVQQGNIDNVVGYLSMEELVLVEDIEKSQIPVSNFVDRIQPHIMIPESKKLIDAIEMLKNDRRALGVVLDEYGGVEGIVTMNQLLGGLLVFDKSSEFGNGNIDPAKEGGNIEIRDDGIVVNALRTTLRTVLEHFEEELSWIPEEEWSIGRLILKKLDRFPKEGEELQIQNLYFRIILMQNRAIQKVFISLASMQQKASKDISL